MAQSDFETGSRWQRTLQFGRSLDRRWWVAGIAILLAFGGAMLSLKPLIRAQARRAAADRGVLLAAEDVSIGWRRIHLDGVSLTLKDVDAVRAELSRVSVSFAWNLAPRAIELAGGEVTVKGDMARLESQLARWRAERPRSAGAGARDGGLELSLTNLNVVWNSGGAAPTAQLSGVGYLRRAEGDEQLTLEHGSVAYEGVELAASEVKLQLERRAGERTLRQLQAGDVAATLRLSESSSGVPEPDAGKVPPSPVAPVPPSSADPGKGGRLHSLAPELDESRGRSLRAGVAAVASAVRSKLPEASTVTLDNLNLTLVRQEEKLHLGPNRFRLERLADRVRVAMVPLARAQGSPVSLALEIPFDSPRVLLKVSGGPVSLASLGVKEGDFSLREVSRSELALNGTLAVGADGESVAAEIDGRLSPLSFSSQSLSPELLRGSSLRWSGKARANLNGSRYEVERLELGLGDVELSLSGVIEKTPEHLKAQLVGGIPLASCQALLDSAPEGLLPLLKGMKLAGTFALDAAIHFDTSDLSKMQVKWDFKNECRMLEVPAELSPRRFLAPFRMQVKDVTGRIVSIETGPGTPGWTPYLGISPNMETGVLICEDGRFFRHRGFDREAIENSIKENIKAGRFVRGASTISMQLAKNLYLSFDKTLSRKLQEAVLTTLLEQELSKEEMMELYLNVIEYGPGIYGIAAAAEHYFKTTPADLSLEQALYLASILPNPAQQHFTETGALSQPWHSYLQRLMKIAVKIGRVGEAEYEAALGQEIHFGEPGAESDGAGMFLPSTPGTDSAGLGRDPSPTAGEGW